MLNEIEERGESVPQAVLRVVTGLEPGLVGSWGRRIEEDRPRSNYGDTRKRRCYRGDRLSENRAQAEQCVV